MPAVPPLPAVLPPVPDELPPVPDGAPLPPVPGPWLPPVPAGPPPDVFPAHAEARSATPAVTRRNRPIRLVNVPGGMI